MYKDDFSTGNTAQTAGENNTLATNSNTKTSAAPAAPGAAGTQQAPLPVVMGCDFFKGPWQYNIRKYSPFASRKTGYHNLDNIQPLYPGIYMLGAQPSVGKTTFGLQLADQIASNHIPVLYFSFEQTTFELYAKILARRIYTESLSNPGYRPFTAMELRTGKGLNSTEEKTEINKYMNGPGGYLYMVTASSTATMEQVENNVRIVRSATHIPPVVVLDYLQILSFSSPNGVTFETRSSVDRNVAKIKEIQKETDATIIVISSLNRMSYLNPIQFDSFKESGGIEYTADVIWGLQFSLMEKPEYVRGMFNTNRLHNLADWEKAMLLNLEKCKPVRELSLVTLKNRFGIATGTAKFKYIPAYDYFEPVL